MSGRASWCGLRGRDLVSFVGTRNSLVHGLSFYQSPDLRVFCLVVPGGSGRNRLAACLLVLPRAELWLVNHTEFDYLTL